MKTFSKTLWSSMTREYHKALRKLRMYESEAPEGFRKEAMVKQLQGQLDQQYRQMADYCIGSGNPYEIKIFDAKLEFDQKRRELREVDKLIAEAAKGLAFAEPDSRAYRTYQRALLCYQEKQNTLQGELGDLEKQFPPAAKPKLKPAKLVNFSGPLWRTHSVFARKFSYNPKTGAIHGRNAERLPHKSMYTVCHKGIKYTARRGELIALLSRRETVPPAFKEAIPIVLDRAWRDENLIWDQRPAHQCHWHFMKELPGFEKAWTRFLKSMSEFPDRWRTYETRLFANLGQLDVHETEKQTET